PHLLHDMIEIEVGGDKRIEISVVCQFDHFHEPTLSIVSTTRQRQRMRDDRDHHRAKHHHHQWPIERTRDNGSRYHHARHEISSLSRRTDLKSSSSRSNSTPG